MVKMVAANRFFFRLWTGIAVKSNLTSHFASQLVQDNDEALEKSERREDIEMSRADSVEPTSLNCEPVPLIRVTSGARPHMVWLIS
jgi:hypothetical protein